jgi:hypothetical protein
MVGATFRGTLFRIEGPGGWTFVEVTSVWTERSGRVLLAVPRRIRGEKEDGESVTVALAAP